MVLEVARTLASALRDTEEVEGVGATATAESAARAMTVMVLTGLWALRPNSGRSSGLP